MSLIKFAAALFAVIAIHELGHHISAMMFGIKAKNFSVGSGPKLIGFKFNKTYFTLGLIPIGGYNEWNEKDFSKLNFIQKIIVYLSGISLNYIAFIISGCIYLDKNLSIGVTKLNGYISPFILEGINNFDVSKIYAADTNIFTTVNEMSEAGSMYSFLFIFFVLNLVMFLFNLLPLPLLDGGKVIVLIIEKLLMRIGICKDKINKFINPLYTISFILLCSPYIVSQTLVIIKNIRNSGYNEVQIFLLYILIPTLTLLLLSTLRTTKIYKKIIRLR